MRYRVVLADDEEEVLFGIRNNLDWESYGFEVAGAFSNGRDVLDFLQTQEVDIVITDIRMPDMSGLELGRRIQEESSGIYLVFLTAYLEYAAESYILEAYQYILKDDMERGYRLS